MPNDATHFILGAIDLKLNKLIYEFKHTQAPHY